MIGSCRPARPERSACRRIVACAVGRVLGFLILGLALIGTGRAETWSFGVVPQQSATRLAQLWTPVLEQVSRASGQTLVFATAPDIPTFEQRLAAGEYAFAYMNPYHFTVFHESPGYIPLLKHRDQPLVGILVTAKGSGITELSQLAGATLAFPAPAAFAASVLPRATLQQQGIPFTAQYVASHDSVYLGVSRGLFKAGGGVRRTFEALPAEVRDQLEIFWQTPPYTPHAIVAHPDVPVAVREAVTQGLLSLTDTEEGRVLVRALQVPRGFEPARSEDWDDVRALGIRLLKD